jgi:hypothetical protein
MGTGQDGDSPDSLITDSGSALYLCLLILDPKTKTTMEKKLY